MKDIPDINDPKFWERNERIMDICQLSVDCMIRIAKGESKDPQLDAKNTLHGCGILAKEDQYECRL